MLQSIRDKSKGPILTIIVVAVCLMFAATGVETILSTGTAGKVGKINGEKITEQELNEAVFLERRKLLAQMGENIDPAMLEEKRLREAALQELIKRKLLLQIADEQEMRVAESEISKLIVNDPDFQQEGRFSNEVFQNVLANAGLTPALYKRLYATDLLLSQISSGIVETGFVTDKETDMDVRFTHQKRDVRYLTLPLTKEKSLISVSDDEVKAYYTEHPEQFQSEESAVVEYIEINQANITPEVTDDEVKTAFDQELAGFKGGEQRDVSHILVQVDADTSKEQAIQQLNDLKSKLAAGEDFAELARAYSEDLGSKEAGGALGVLNGDAFPDAFVKAAQKLSPGQVSDIVETESGLHLVYLNSLEVVAAPTLEERYEAIKSDLQTAKAAPLYLQSLEKLKDLAFNSPDLSDPAAAVGAMIQESAPITRHGGQGLFSNKKVYDQVFMENVLKNGENSDVIELGPTQAIVLRLKHHDPAALIPFDEVATKARDLLVTDKAKIQLAEKAEALRAELFAGADIEALARKDGLEWQVTLAAIRNNPQSDREVIAAAFQLPSPPAGRMVVDKIQKINGDYVVLTVSNVKDGSVNDFNPMETPMFRNFMVRAAAMQEFSALEAGIKAKSEVDIY